MNTVQKIILIALLPIAAQAASVKLDGDILLFVPGPDGQMERKSLWQPSISGGNFESHSREGRSDYHGAPWNLVVFLDEEGMAQVVFWIDDEDYWLDDQDERLIDERFDATSLKPKSFDLFDFEDGAKLMLNLTPALKDKPLSEVSMSNEIMGSDFLCLRQSSIVVDRAFHLGTYSGFGEYIRAGVPGIAYVTMSLQNQEGWEPIGTYKNGVIEVSLPENHLLNVYGVKYGPAGFDRGGPFTIFGSVDPSNWTPDEARKFQKQELERTFDGDRLAVLGIAVDQSPFGGVGGFTVGNSKDWSAHLERVKGGFWGDGLPECGE